MWRLNDFCFNCNTNIILFLDSTQSLNGIFIILKIIAISSTANLIYEGEKSYYRTCYISNNLVQSCSSDDVSRHEKLYLCINKFVWEIVSIDYLATGGNISFGMFNQPTIVYCKFSFSYNMKTIFSSTSCCHKNCSEGQVLSQLQDDTLITTTMSHANHLAHDQRDITAL